MPCEEQQLLLASFLGNTAQRPHLRVRELAAGKGRVDARQFAQAPRDPHVLPRRARAQAAAPGEPLGAGTAYEPAPAVELSYELEPAAGAGVDVRGEGRDLILELVQ